MSTEFEPHPIDSAAPTPSPRRWRWRYVLLGILVVLTLAGLHLLRQAL